MGLIFKHRNINKAHCFVYYMCKDNTTDTRNLVVSVTPWPTSCMHMVCAGTLNVQESKENIRFDV